MRGDLVQYLKAVAEERAVVEWEAWWEQHHDELRACLPAGWYYQLQQKGSRAAGEVLLRLGVAFEAPEAEPEVIGEGGCPLCGSSITHQERWLHYKLSDGGGGWWYQGKCLPCDIDFRVQLQSGIPAVWRPDAPEVEELTGRLSPEALQQLHASPPREFLYRETWQEFVTRARAEDEYWMYQMSSFPPETPPSIARVRRGVPIARFPILPAEFWNSSDPETP